MSTKTVTRRRPLKCLNCGHEFEGWALLKEHYVESGMIYVRTVFDRATENCPVCRSHMVEERN